MRLIHLICDSNHFQQIKQRIQETSVFGEVVHYPEPPEDTVDAFIIAHVRYAGDTGADVWFRWEDEKEYENTELQHLVLPRDMDELVDVLENLAEKGDALMLSPSLLGDLDEGAGMTGEAYFTVGEHLSGEDSTPSGIQIPPEETVAMPPEEGMTSPGFRFTPREEENRTKAVLNPSTHRDDLDQEEEQISAASRHQADPARMLWHLHQESFDGYLDVPVRGNRTRLWWRSGVPVALEGAGSLLVRLLQMMGEVRINAFLLERSRDPVALAVKQGSIAEDETHLWRHRLMVEVMSTLCSMEFLPHPAGEPSYSIQSSWDLEFEALLMRSVVEGYDGARSLALMEGAELETIDGARWESLRYSPLVDITWVQAVGLAQNGVPWQEAVIRSGMGSEEGYSLLYALKLMGIASPELPHYPTRWEMVRRRIVGLLERAGRFPPEELLDGRGAVARRRYQDIMVMLEQVPPLLTAALADRISHLKKLLNYALEQVG